MRSDSDGGDEQQDGQQGQAEGDAKSRSSSSNSGSQSGMDGANEQVAPPEMRHHASAVEAAAVADKGECEPASRAPHRWSRRKWT